MLLKFGQQALAQLGRRALCTGPRVSSAAVAISHADRVLTVSTGAGSSSGQQQQHLRFPLAWLRDNCRCPACYSAGSALRNLKMLDFDPRAGIASAEVGASGDLQVSWQDGHSSCYGLDWLRAAAFGADDPSGARQRVPPSRHRPLLWCDQSPASVRPARFSFNELLSSDSTLLAALLELERRGLALLEGCGVEVGAVGRLCRRLAFPRTTHYGETFEMKAEAKPRNLGYTTERLDYHTDLPYLHEQPGVQALLCLRQAPDPGGDSLFADGFSAAELLRRSRPDLFRLLAEVPVRFRDRSLAGKGFDLIASHRTVELEEAAGSGASDGAVSARYRRIHFSNQQRDSLQSWPLDHVQPMYDALKAFNDVVEGGGQEDGGGDVRLQVKLRPGEMALFDNSRLLHSRTAFVGERHLAGAYMLWDEVLSRRRTLEEGAQTAELHGAPTG